MAFSVKTISVSENGECMYTEYCISDEPRPNAPLLVYNIYRVKADATYQSMHAAHAAGRKIFVCTDAGCGNLRCAEGEFVLSAQTALLFSADSPFAYHTDGDVWNFWWFEFDGTVSWPVGTVYPVQEREWIEELGVRALEALRAEPSAAAAYLSCLVTLLPEKARKEADWGNELISHARKIIRDKLYRNNVSSLAQELGVEVRTLYSIFLHYAGCGPKEYLSRYVIDMACFLLQSTVKSIGEIADELGFSNQFHFSRVFKAYIGVPPSVYRNQANRM